MSTEINEQETPNGLARAARHVRVAVIGAGFSGLSIACRLREQGVEDFLIVERSSTAGGVWRDNTYPGVQCDIPSHLYSLSFAPNPDWERAFSKGTQIHAYLRKVAAERLLGHQISYQEEVLRADWDDSRLLWRISTSKRNLTADVLIACAGPLTEPALPDVPGVTAFKGVTMHSNRWDHTHDLTGRRVAVVGTGASAVQLIPELQKAVAHLVVLQRTPGWVLPRPDRAIPAAEQRLLRRFPGLTRLYRIKQWALRDTLGYRLIRRNPGIRRLQQRQARKFLARTVPDPQLRAKLTPDYEIGCKRILMTNEYLPALARPNVTVVDSALSELTEQSVIAANGEEHPVDAVVFATGFDITDAPVFDRIHGRDGQSLAQTWKGRPHFYKGGTTVAGFPNFFNICSGGAGSGHASMVWQAEAQTAYVMDALRTMDRHRIGSVEPRQEAQQRYMKWVKDELGATVWLRGGCHSWYLDADELPTIMWPKSMIGFRRLLRRFDLENFETRSAQFDQPRH
ncbi:flavin-containing monooxygenase [Streptomyces sp. NPDC096132]|uniref:flavin-containing monooxygenase n=1 Tax=Streptomyces sp. NPDC096132 TaxID=3366075 RepID=UPI0038223F1B